MNLTCRTPAIGRSNDIDSYYDSEKVLTAFFGALAAMAKGETVITGAEELRHKESDRIDALAGELRKAAAVMEIYTDGSVADLTSDVAMICVWSALMSSVTASMTPS